MKNILVDNPELQWILSLGDGPLVIGQRLSEWCGHGPVLEQGMALTNIALDTIGQARLIYQYAAEFEDKNRTEDDYAYWRLSNQFFNPLLCELPNGDFGQTILKQFIFSSYLFHSYQQLSSCDHERIRGIAIKSLKEVTYHRRYTGEWVIRLGDGTEESHTRMTQAIENIWRYIPELWTPASYEKSHSPIAFDTLEKNMREDIKNIFEQATLTIPDDTVPQLGGKTGSHTEHLSYLLAEMQTLQRTYPDATW